MTAPTLPMSASRLPFNCLGLERTTRFLCDAQMLNVMADGLPGIIAYFDVNFVCHFVNETVEAWTGARPASFLNKRLSDISPDFASGSKPGLERALAGEYAEFEIPADFASGMINVVRGFAYPDKDAAGRVQGAFLLLLDITRERAIEAQLQAARDVAIEANRSKSRFLAAASHDLRQPLHAMTLFVSALSRRLASGENGELIANVDQSLRSLRSMIDALLDMSKIEAGLIKAALAPMALDEFFESLKAGFVVTARDRNLTFRVAKTCGHVIADRTLLELALRNLLANALKFTRTGGVLLGVRRGRGEWGISVIDTGIGIAPDRANLVFQEFHREKMAAHGPNDGIGLGLAIAKRLTEMMGGRLTLRSRPGKGSTFTIWLRHASAPRRVNRAVSAGDGSLDGVRILILDDDPLCAAAMKQEFQDQGAVVSAANSISAARAAIDASGMPQAMVVDYDLSGGDTGLQFVDVVRAKGAHAGIVLVSGSTNADAIAALRGSGLPWLTKPVDPRALRATLLHAIAG
jgi:signal transduction histidine kinase/CheY-like chemotaxis protein